MEEKKKRIKKKSKIFLETEKEKEERNESDKKKKHNETIIKNKIIGDIKTLFEQEEDYYKPETVSSFWNGDKNNNKAIKVMAIKATTYH